MKIEIKKILMFILVLVVAALLNSCINNIESPEHEHTFADNYTTDNIYHWFSATCGHLSEVKDKEKHFFGEWTEILSATEEREGVKIRFCTICKYSETDIIPYKEHSHSFSEEWEKNNLCHWHVAICGHLTEIKDYENHKFGEWIYGRTISEEYVDLKVRICSICKYEDIVSITDNEFFVELDGVKRLFEKTELVTVIPKGSTSVIPNENCTVTDWANYTHFSDVFSNRRTITLNSYTMGKYPVTQELYQSVMGSNPCPDRENKYGNDVQSLRPVAGVNWYEAVIFCNELSRKCGYEEVFTISNIIKKNVGMSTEYVSSATVTYDLSKNGFRLPTEAEWEYAARGAGISSEDWNYEYAGSNNCKKVAWNILTSSGYSDDDDVLRTHEVGLKMPNALGLYDMSGNVTEWCMDWYRSVTESGDMNHGNSVPATGNETDPILSLGKYDNHVIRGGYYSASAGECSIWQRLGLPAYSGFGGAQRNSTGFRIVRRP